jgi:hypothetical protein
VISGNDTGDSAAAGGARITIAYRLGNRTFFTGGAMSNGILTGGSM